ncbi:RDD family protein [Endozoicomonas euniceicola]|uniref:RDD family protein n=1 Tax=Endozoicomonas euniceicola TaxID=1234143 RepID=A0ABY6GV05_9GAMM|nr:RDD family protein [Endozoicomonas euniceicola]UYM16600.1 RDD family protein [Endozoicomonas euniceicola]
MQKQQTTMKPAPLWRRLAAMIYDTFLVISLILLVGFLNLGILKLIYGIDQLQQMTDNGQFLDSPALHVALYLTIFSFFGYFWTRRGQTLGMQAWRLHVLNENGTRISAKQALMRFLVAIPSVLAGCIGVIWVLWDKNKKSWQDYASRSGTYHIPAQRDNNR